MKRNISSTLSALRLVGFLGMVSLLAAGPEVGRARPLAHAHNDYVHARPLLDALAQGFDSVEADIYLVDGQLLVAHDRKDLRTERTLEKLYLDPLAHLARSNGGWIKGSGKSLTLLVDVKSEAEPTFAALHDVLLRYADLLTGVDRDQTTVRAITVIVSGNRAAGLIAAQQPRLVALDGRIPDIERGGPPHLMPWISANWRDHFTWRGEGEFQPREKEKLRALVADTHAKGRQLRFWNTSDRPEVWQELRTAGVDVIGTDDLVGLKGFLDRSL